MSVHYICDISPSVEMCIYIHRLVHIQERPLINSVLLSPEAGNMRKASHETCPRRLKVRNFRFLYNVQWFPLFCSSSVSFRYHEIWWIILWNANIRYANSGTFWFYSCITAFYFFFTVTCSMFFLVKGSSLDVETLEHHWCYPAQPWSHLFAINYNPPTPPYLRM